MSHGEEVRRLTALVVGIANEYKGFLPHENAPGEFDSKNPKLSSDTRTRLMSIEDAIRKATQIEGDCGHARREVL
jgi:hypothetical protein